MKLFPINARQCTFSAILTICCISLAAQAYTRGRVKVVNNTVVTDQGTLLRGVDALLFSGKDTYTYSKDWYAMVKRNGFNSVRLAVQFCPQWQSDLRIAPKIPYIDTAVNVAESLGMYIGIDFHDVFGTTTDTLLKFWDIVAPRYKNRTHVIYELANEPNWGIQNEPVFYARLRALAPLTHIILFSFARPDYGMLDQVNQNQQGINWTNASVGYHPYFSSTADGIIRLHTKFPCMTTELTPHPGVNDWNSMQPLNGDSWGWVKWHEQVGISWWLWYCGSMESELQPLLSDARNRGYMWQPDNFTTMVTVPVNGPDAADPRTIFATPKGLTMNGVAPRTARVFDITGKLVTAGNEGVNALRSGFYAVRSESNKHASAGAACLAPSME
jgi:hypothetical protein